MLMNLVPVVGVFFSVIILNEALHSIQLIGGIVIIVGVILSIQSGKKQYNETLNESNVSTL
jgi:drug/metabolite transporter (DMT)-like permease